MKANTKNLLIAAGVVFGAALVWIVWKKITATKEEFQAMLAKGYDIVTWPARSVLGLVQSTAGNAAAAASLPALAAQSASLDQQLATINQNDYAPGGRIYEEIRLTRGRAAADKAWADVQANLASQRADTAAWWKFWQ